MAAVVITRGEKIDEALGHVELEPLVRGRVVAVKPNDTWASEDDTTGGAQPDTLRAVLRPQAPSGCCCRACRGYTFGLGHKILLVLLVAFIGYLLLGVLPTRGQ